MESFLLAIGIDGKLFGIMILDFIVYVVYCIRNSTSFIVSCTVIITKGFYHNETPPVFWIICLIHFSLSQLKQKCKEHPGTDYIFCWQVICRLLALLLG